MKRIATKFAASTLVIALAMVGCQANIMTSPATASTEERSNAQASRLAEQARAALERGDTAEALSLAERAVEMAPRDAGYRMLLADLYLKNGRFRSAETSYSDVAEIDAGNVRAGLSIALAQIAQDRSGDAIATLEEVQDRAPAADVGLAFALAGDPQRAIAVLEPAARAADANGRTRQNLALAYAFAGDWQRARTVAAQDVSPAELGARLQHWATMARPSSRNGAVAALLGVTPADDPGQPVRLALNGAAPAAVAYAEAAPAPEPEQASAEEPGQYAEVPVQYAETPAPVAEEPAAAEPIRYAEATVVVEPAPVRYAAAPAPAAEPAGAWWPAESEAAPAPAPVRFAAAEPVRVPAPVRAEDFGEAPAPAAVASILSAPSPVLQRSVAPARTSRPVFAPAPVNRAVALSARIPAAVSANGNFVVQLGAFANPGNAERAWNSARQRYGLTPAQGRTASVTVGGRELTRVSIAGFRSRGEAVRLCSSIQAQGGSCFVRATAGDAPVPVRWASNGASQRRG
jgi:Flp pilus assembly protein TadD